MKKQRAEEEKQTLSNLPPASKTRLSKKQRTAQRQAEREAKLVFADHSRVRSACHVSPCLSSCRVYATPVVLVHVQETKQPKPERTNVKKQRAEKDKQTLSNLSRTAKKRLSKERRTAQRQAEREATKVWAEFRRLGDMADEGGLLATTEKVSAARPTIIPSDSIVPLDCPAILLSCRISIVLHHLVLWGVSLAHAACGGQRGARSCRGCDRGCGGRE